MSQTKVAAPFVSNNANFRNLIINGDMQIAQRGTSTTGLGDGDSGYYTCDRWAFTEGGSSAAVFTQTQSTDVPTGQGFSTSLKMDCTTADTSLASNEIFRIDHRIEGQFLQHLAKGTSSAKKVTLSFWVKSSKTGTHIVRYKDQDNSRHICAAYTIASADTWEHKTMTFDGDTTGAFDNDNAKSLQIEWYLFAGSDYTSGTLATSWASSTDANSGVGQVNVADSTSNNWYLTGVQLEVGDAATDFEHLPRDVQLQRCQRYYQKLSGAYAQNAFITNGFYNGASQFQGSYSYMCNMRAAPSLLHTAGTSYYAVARVLSSDYVDEINGLKLYSPNDQAGLIYWDGASGTAGGGGVLYINSSSVTEAALSAEL